ncbi:MAG: hypothetical protein JWM87_680 [Candidatus Eremiobacteraeota bacterium]|nr:hypothetical protein [Candidatus Eremiobacteraeota bacterium]
MFLYGDVPPSFMTDEQIERTIAEVDEALAACAKLKPGSWRTRVRTNGSWQDDPRSNCAEIIAPDGDPVERLFESSGLTIASGTVYDTQREVFFMAAMRDEYPALLGLYRSALIYIRELRKKAARKKGRRR